MKKFYAKNFAYGAAALLVGAVGLTGCSSDDELTNVNPTYDGESVKTQFAISIPGALKTRMGQDIVQANNAFRGMMNIRLVPFDLDNTPTGTSEPLTGTETMRYNAILLGNIGASDLKSNSNAKLYTDVDIPLGTNAFLFYAEALESAGDNSDATNGALVPSFESTGLPVGAKISDISFSLKGILGKNSVTNIQDKLCGILNGLANDVTGNDGKKWAEATGDLKSYYTDFLSLKAGSANNICLAIQDLYTAMQSARVTDESGLKLAISNKIKSTFDVTGDVEPYKLSYNESNKDVENYPNNLGLPDGAVQVRWNSGNSKFEYITSVDYDATGQNTFNVASLNEYVFPSSLYYWLNTNIKTSNTSESTLYDGTNTWDAILNSYTNGYEVTATTQSIALENKIDYAVGRLDVYAKFASGEIMDKGEPAKAVTIPADGFTLTGVLVGGQKAVNWNFDTNSSASEYTVYDSKVPTSTGVSRTDGLKNSTLLLETEKNMGEKVNFALEFVNNGTEAFVGADGIVPVGGKFYLVGQLVSTAANQKVFEKDHITKANVTISSLKNAYNCIPDLRSPKLELGLSVDLTWETGLTFDVTIGGNN